MQMIYTTGQQKIKIYYFSIEYILKMVQNQKWFNKKDIKKYPSIMIDNLHGYVLPHAGTSHSGEILSHSLRFKPKKDFKYILIIYLPSNKEPNVGNEYHEYVVPSNTLKLFYPNKTYIGYNMLTTKPNISHLNKNNTLYVISADFSHFLLLQDAIQKENCAAHSMMHKIFNLDCVNIVDDARSFKKMYSLIKEIQLQWIGRTRSTGEKGVGYLSFLIRDKPDIRKKPDGFFVTAYDSNMNQRECLGNTKQWTKSLELSLKKDVIQNAQTTSRLTNGKFLDIPVTHYTITYLYKDKSKDFIRGYHAILKDALYLPDVFLENTYDNGTWIKSTDTTWPKSNIFTLTPTFSKLQNKAGVQHSNSNYQLFYSEVTHHKIKLKRKTIKKR